MQELTGDAVYAPVSEKFPQANALMGELAPVSVVIPCYRCTSSIGRALASVYTQTWRPAEVWLIEDGSGDDTLVQLHGLQNAYPTGWVNVIALQTNGGPGTARNVGWDAARQPYVAFLDADDAWHPEKIKLQLLWMVAHPDVAITGHTVRVERREDKEMVIVAAPVFRPVSPIKQLLSNRYPVPSMIVRRDINYRFRPGKRYCEDFLLVCEVCLDGLICCHANSSLAILFKEHYGESGLTKSLWPMEQGELDMYVRLYRAGRLSLFALLFVLPFSLAKYFWRCIKVATR